MKLGIYEYELEVSLSCDILCILVVILINTDLIPDVYFSFICFGR